MLTTRLVLKVAIDRYISRSLKCGEKLAVLPVHRGVFISWIFHHFTCAIIHRKELESVNTKKKPQTNILSFI